MVTSGRAGSLSGKRSIIDWLAPTQWRGAAGQTAVMVKSGRAGLDFKYRRRWGLARGGGGCESMGHVGSEGPIRPGWFIPEYDYCAK
jgi:hypothetical protein